MISSVLLQIVQNVGTAADTATQALVGIPQAAQPATDTFSLMDLLIAGGPIMIPIVIMSVLAIYIFIERYLSIRQASRFEEGFMNNIRDFIYNNRIDSAISYCKSNKSPVARMIEKGIKRLGRPLKEIEESIEIVGKFEVYKLEKNIVILAIIAGIAPMFGFIGTIIGVIKIFHDISLAGDVSITTVSSGLYVKMVSSAAGLLVGITSFILYHWCNIMVDKAVQKLEYTAMEFVDLLQEPSK
jgi:biopolymer transport protein ExbB